MPAPFPGRLRELNEFGFCSEELADAQPTSPPVRAQALDVKLLELYGGALRSFVAVVSHKAVDGYFRVCGIDEVVAQRLAGGNTFGGRVCKHCDEEGQGRGAVGVGLTVFCREIEGDGDQLGEARGQQLLDF